jgi:hypothetical protein
MAKAPKQAKAKQAALKGKDTGKAGGNRSLVWLSGLACGALVAIAPGTALVAACLLAPSIVALKLDHEPGRPMARTVLTCGLAGCVQPVLTLWNAGQSLDAAFAIVTDPTMAGIAWSAAAAGWLLTQLAPMGVRAVLEASSLTRATRLRLTRARIAEAWGLEKPAEEPAELSGPAARIV